MIQANLILANVRAYDVRRFAVQKGEVFRIEIDGTENRLRWFSDEDKVLDIVDDEDGKGATVTASAVGRSTIALRRGGHIMAHSEALLTLHITVFAPQAVSLNPVASEPELK
jgi:hypothetical protein